MGSRSKQTMKMYKEAQRKGYTAPGGDRATMKSTLDPAGYDHKFEKVSAVRKRKAEEEKQLKDATHPKG